MQPADRAAVLQPQIRSGKRRKLQQLHDHLENEKLQGDPISEISSEGEGGEGGERTSTIVSVAGGPSDAGAAAVLPRSVWKGRSSKQKSSLLFAHNQTFRIPSEDFSIDCDHAPTGPDSMWTDSTMYVNMFTP